VTPRVPDTQAPATPVPSQPTHWGQIALISLTQGMTWAGFSAILPILPLFLKEQGHASVRTWSLIVAVMYAGTLIFSTPLGRLSDRIGRKPLLVSGTLLYAVATLLFITTANPWWFMLFRFLEGVGTAAVTPAGNAFVADNTSDSTRSQAFGWLITAQFGGVILGPAIGILISVATGGSMTRSFHAVCIIGCVLALLISGLLALFIHDSAEARVERRAARLQKRPRWRELLTPPIVAFLVIAFTAHFAMGGWEALWSWWLNDLGATNQYIFATWLAFGIPTLFSFLGGRVADRGNRFWLMYCGYAFAAFAWVIYGTTHNLTLFITMNFLEGAAMAISFPAKSAFLVQVSPRRWLGSVQGIEQTVMQVAMLIGTLTAPWLYSSIGGFAIGIGGFLLMGGLIATGPGLHREWGRIRASGEVLSYAETERLATREASGVLSDQIMGER
jgi:MFS family permease